jgi:hypothetical protein
MTTTLRSDRRIRRNATFNLEYLDDRIVLSAASVVAVAQAHLAAEVSAGNTKAAAKATITLDRDEVRLAKVEAREEAKVARYDAKHHVVLAPPTPTPTATGTSSSGATVSASATVTGTATASPTPPTAVTGTPTASPTATPATASSTATPASIATPAATTTVNVAATTTASSSSSSTTTTLPANLGAQLQVLYNEYESSGGSSSFTPTGVDGILISGDDVGINFQSSDTADFNSFLSQLQSDGLQVSTDSATYGIIDGMLPIAQLPTVAQISSSASVTPLTLPKLD